MLSSASTCDSDSTKQSLISHRQAMKACLALGICCTHAGSPMRSSELTNMLSGIRTHSGSMSQFENSGKVHQGF